MVCHGLKGRKWLARGPDVPTRWFPKDDLDADSFAFGVLYGKKPDDPMPRKIGADAWFDRRDAEQYTVYEQSIRAASDEVLTLVLISDSEMLEEATVMYNSPAIYRLLAQALNSSSICSKVGLPL